MTSLTLKNVPAKLMKRLRSDAVKDRRSLNQQVLYVLERALEAPGTSASRLDKWRASVTDWAGMEEALEGIEDRSPPRDVEL